VKSQTTLGSNGCDGSIPHIETVFFLLRVVTETVTSIAAEFHVLIEEGMEDLDVLPLMFGCDLLLLCGCQVSHVSLKFVLALFCFAYGQEQDAGRST
jgi:hypothetical protein